MTATPRVKTSFIAGTVAPSRPAWRENDAPDAVASPARAFQARIATIYGPAAVDTVPEPSEPRWPGWASVGFLAVTAAASWALVVGAGVLILRALS
jgi:hypothetical protein